MDGSTLKSDTELQHDVIEELKWEPSVDASRIGVIAKGGVVTLTGSVPIYADKVEAERIAKSFGGVKAVENDITMCASKSMARLFSRERSRPGPNERRRNVWRGLRQVER